MIYLYAVTDRTCFLGRTGTLEESTEIRCTIRKFYYGSARVSYACTGARVLRSHRESDGEQARVLRVCCRDASEC